MKYFYLVWKSVWRKKVRTILTVLSVLVAFLLYGLLSAFNLAFRGGVDVANASRLVTIDKISLINPVPASYQQKIKAVPGVKQVAMANWFGGYYQDKKAQFAQFPVDPETYLEVYPELKLPADQKEKWLNTRDSAIVGRDLVNRYGWKVGDRIPIHSEIWTNESGSQVWDFEIAGIFDTEDPRDSTALMLFHYKYFDEGRAFAKGNVGWYVLTIDDPSRAAEIANAIDTQFANSPNETKTSTEAAFAESFVKQLGNIALIVRLILTAVFFTILLVAGNTMAQSVRERLSELAVLKTLGFGNGSVMGIVLAESILVMLLGGLIGLGLAWALLVLIARQAAAILPAGLMLNNEALLTGLLLMVLAGFAAGVFPALRAMRLTIVEALARS
jgi:putative ABC transport system permease protein